MPATGHIPGPGYVRDAINAALANAGGSVTLTATALTMVANVSGATANSEIQDSSAQLSQAEYRVFAKTIVTQINALRTDLAALKAALD